MKKKAAPIKKKALKKIKPVKKRIEGDVAMTRGRKSDDVHDLEDLASLDEIEKLEKEEEDDEFEDDFGNSGEEHS